VVLKNDPLLGGEESRDDTLNGFGVRNTDRASNDLLDRNEGGTGAAPTHNRNPL
jgi:hypothetical protein